jgi:hypothetical protein
MFTVGAFSLVFFLVEAARDFLLVVVRRRVCPKALEAVKAIRQARTIIWMRFKRVSLLRTLLAAPRVFALILRERLIIALCLSS